MTGRAPGAGLPSILTLNLSRPPVGRAKALLEYLWLRAEEVLVLTETGWGAGSDLVASVCRGAGYSVQSSLHDGSGRRRRLASGDRAPYGVLVVSRGPELTRADGLDVPLMPERVLVTEMPGPAGPVRLIAVYGAASDPVRYASSVQRQRKRDWLLAFVTWLSLLPEAPTLIVGDLNVVAPGHPDKLPYVLAEERTAYDVLTRGLGYRDLAAGDLEPTWVDHAGVGCRYDYVLASADLEVTGRRPEIDQAPRLRGLTDHAALSWRP
ncbi:endonuclease/exonuclease/phosphatase family protein [Nostocoides australiense]